MSDGDWYGERFDRDAMGIETDDDRHGWPKCELVKAPIAGWTFQEGQAKWLWSRALEECVFELRPFSILKPAATMFMERI